MFLNDDEQCDFNYFQNNESDECMYEFELNDFDLNKNFDNMENYKKWGLVK